MALNATHEVAVNGDQVAAALRAQASGLGAASAPDDPHVPTVRSDHAAPPGRLGLPGWALLALAVLLGALAGGLAGVISVW